MASSDNVIQVTLAQAPAARQVIELEMTVPARCTAWQALDLAGWSNAWSEADLRSLSLGVWGRRVGRDHELREGDRLEVYRALRVDPKVARRERFTGQGTRGTGLFARRKPGSKAGY